MEGRREALHALHCLARSGGAGGGEAAERAAVKLRKGSRVVVTGRLRQRTFENDEGEPRTVMELVADEVATTLRDASAAITKTDRAASEPAVESEPVA
jgi:single-strand DNA-binding protein